jgi:hypothetical protein
MECVTFVVDSGLRTARACVTKHSPYQVPYGYGRYRYRTVVTYCTLGIRHTNYLYVPSSIIIVIVMWCHLASVCFAKYSPKAKWTSQ